MEPEQSSNAAGDVITDEWGKYIVKEEGIKYIDRDGVLENIQQNNPAITAVMLLWTETLLARLIGLLLERALETVGKYCI